MDILEEPTKNYTDRGSRIKERFFEKADILHRPIGVAWTDNTGGILIK